MNDMDRGGKVFLALAAIVVLLSLMGVRFGDADDCSYNSGGNVVHEAC